MARSNDVGFGGFAVSGTTVTTLAEDCFPRFGLGLTVCSCYQLFVVSFISSCAEEPLIYSEDASLQ